MNNFNFNNVDKLKTQTNIFNDNSLIPNKFNPCLLSNLDMDCVGKSNKSSKSTKSNKSTKSKLKLQTINETENNFVKDITKSTQKYNKNNTDKQDKDKNQEKIQEKIQDLKYWEYGNSGLKIQNFTKIMAKNLAILYHIDKSFEILLSQHKFSIKKLYEPNYPNLYEDIVETDGIASSIESSNGQVTLKISSKKFSGNYKLVGMSKTIIKQIDKQKFLSDSLVKCKIPDLDTVLNNIDNIKLPIRLTNVLKLIDDLDFEIECDYSDFAFDFDNIKNRAFEKITEYRKDNKEKNLLKSNSNFAFYIKIYETHGKAFVIDGPSNLIYYIKEQEDLILKYIYKFVCIGNI